MNNLLTLKIENSKTIGIKCYLFTPDKSRNEVITLIYDTGADKTSITRDALKMLGYANFAPSKKPKRTALGVFIPDTCMISDLIIGRQFKMSNAKVDVLEIASTSTFDGIIGMDFITMHENYISGSENTLTISSKKLH